MPSIDPRTLQAIVIAKALCFYAKHKLSVNSAYTPKAMLTTAARITGKTYKHGQYIQAAQDLEALYEL
jgi:hypothetical protein